MVNFYVVGENVQNHILMKILIIGLVLCVCVSNLKTQEPILVVDFEDEKGISTTSGISGQAFDLGPHSIHRYALALENPMHDSGSDFSVTVWVKSPEESDQNYVILSSLIPNEETYSGWKISVQANGAWKFDVKKKEVKYEYQATIPRQTIRNGDWHLLGVTYDATKSELRFYYDGSLMAIYNAPGIEGFYSGTSIIIGNSIDSEHSRVTGETTDPRFVLTEWDSFYGWIDDVKIYSSLLDAQSIASYYHKVSETEPVVDPGVLPDLLKVTSFNIWHGGNRSGKEIGRQRLIDILKQTNSDAFMIIETYGSGEELADALGYYLYLISTNLSILSRYPISETYKVFDPFHSGGLQVLLPGGQKVNLFCIWLSSYPQYFIKGLTSDESWPLDQYMEEENASRGAEMKEILEEMVPYLRVADSIPLVVGGDFNSGSHLDWIEETAFMHNGYIVPWPVSKALEKAGFRDSFRELHPDPQKSPGISWSPTRTFPLKDRIDYIYYMGKSLEAIKSEVIGQHPVSFPSDHAGISTEFRAMW